MSARKAIKLSGLVNAGKVIVTEPSGPSLLAQALQMQPEAAQDAPVVEPSLPAALPIQPSPSPLSGEPSSPSNVLQQVRLDTLYVSPYQPRTRMSDEAMDFLRASVDVLGITAPITVRPVAAPAGAAVLGEKASPTGQMFEIVCGHRRTEAARSLGLDTVPAYVRTLTDEEAEQLARLDNENSEPLCDFDRAKNFAAGKRKGLTQSRIAQEFGCSQALVSECLALLDLPPDFLQILERNPAAFSAKTGKVIRDLRLAYPENTAVIVEAVQRIADGKLDQKALRASVELRLQPVTATRNTHRRVVDKQGKTLFTLHLKPKERSVIVQCDQADADLDAIEALLRAALESAQQP